MPHDNNSQISPEEAKASLGLATFLQDQMMLKGQPEAVEGQEAAEMGQEQGQNPQSQEDLIQQVKQAVDEELTAFKQDLLTALEDDEDGDQEAKTDKETEE